MGSFATALAVAPLQTTCCAWAIGVYGLYGLEGGYDQ